MSERRHRPARGRRAGPARRTAGFTLVELLVAITLLGLIAVLLAGGLRFGARAWERGSEVAEDASDLALVQAFVRRQLGGARPLRRRGEELAKALDFVGEPDGVEFVVLMPAHLDVPGFYRIAFRLERDQDGRHLLMERRTFDLGDDLGAGKVLDQRILIDRIAGGEFTYFGAAEEGDPPQWREQWQDATILPELVRLKMHFPVGDRRSWPELTMRTRITARGDLR